MVTRRCDQSDASHIVQGTWTMVMRAARDRDPNIARDHAIRRQWSEGRAHACGTKARGAAARGIVPQGPEDVAGKSGRVEDQHQVKQDRRCIEKKADLHSGKCVHHVVKSF